LIFSISLFFSDESFAKTPTLIEEISSSKLSPEEDVVINFVDRIDEPTSVSVTFGATGSVTNYTIDHDLGNDFFSLDFGDGALLYEETYIVTITDLHLHNRR